MQTIIQNCIDGCGRQRIVHIPDDAPPPQAWNVHTEEQQIQLNGAAQAIIARRLQLRNDLEAIKANNPVWWAQVFG